MRSNSNSIKTNYIFTVINKFVSLFVPILVTPYLSRILGPDGNGVISYIYSYASYFIIFANLGIETYGQRIIAINRNEPNKLKQLLLEVFLLRLFLTLFAVIVYGAIFLRADSADDFVLFLIFAVNIIAVPLDFTWFFQGLEKFKLISIVNIVSRIVYIVFVFIFVKVKEDINIAAILYMMSMVLPYLLSAPFIFIGISGKLQGKIRPFSHLKECFVYFIPTVATQIYTVLDKTMIGLITQSDFENGYYEQADKIVKLAVTVVTSINIIMRSRISYLYEQKREEEIKILIEKSANLMFCLSLPLMLGTIAIANSFVPIYLGEGYDECVNLLYILSPVILIIGVSNLIGTHYYTPFDKQSTSNKFLITGSVVNFILNIFLIKLLASAGAAIASIIAEFIITCLYVFFARKFIDFKKFFCISIKYLIASIVMFVPTLIMSLMLPVSIIWIIVEICVAVLIYGVSLLILRPKFVSDMLKHYLLRGKRNGRDK